MKPRLHGCIRSTKSKSSMWVEGFVEWKASFANHASPWSWSATSSAKTNNVRILLMEWTDVLAASFKFTVQSDQHKWRKQREEEDCYCNKAGYVCDSFLTRSILAWCQGQRRGKGGWWLGTGNATIVLNAIRTTKVNLQNSLWLERDHELQYPPAAGSRLASLSGRTDLATSAEFASSVIRSAKQEWD